MDKLTILDGCVGCRVCEMICSYHHTGAFSYEASSVTVGRAEDKRFGLYRCTDGAHQPCDRCAGEDEPLCIKYCPKNKGQDALRAFITGEGAAK